MRYLSISHSRHDRFCVPKGRPSSSGTSLHGPQLWSQIRHLNFIGFPLSGGLLGTAPIDSRSPGHSTCAQCGGEDGAVPRCRRTTAPSPAAEGSGDQARRTWTIFPSSDTPIPSVRSQVDLHPVSARVETDDLAPRVALVVDAETRTRVRCHLSRPSKTPFSQESSGTVTCIRGNAITAWYILSDSS